MTMTALRFVKRLRTGIFSKFGHTAAKTCGIVSPTMIPNATMPPNANAHWAIEIAISPVFPKQCCTVP